MTKNLCITCVHYLGLNQCEAFLNKIPQEIIAGTNDHTKPLKDQKNNIVFEPIDKPKQ